MILQNDQVVDLTPGLSNFANNHKFCFENFDLQNDIFELRHSGGNNGVTISVNLIYQGETSQLLFGLQADLTWIKIDGDGLKCKKDVEAAYTLRVQNGKIIESECIGLFINFLIFNNNFGKQLIVLDHLLDEMINDHKSFRKNLSEKFNDYSVFNLNPVLIPKFKCILKANGIL